MKIVVAKNAGFCFGVKRAVSETLEAVKNRPVSTLGELIHNDQVIEMLKEEGVRVIENTGEIRQDETVVIRSHGVAPSVYDSLKAKNIDILDLTCPFVQRIHQKVAKDRDQYDIVVIVGKEDHPEVIGTKGWAGDRVYVVNSVEDVKRLPAAESALVVAQTTITHALLDETCTAIRKKIGHVDLFDSICETTIDRQMEAEKLAKTSDAVIVVGGKHSSNAQKLYEISAKNCGNVQYIQNINELSLDNFKTDDIISIVAGASTPDWLIREVKTRMSELENIQATEQNMPEAQEKNQEHEDFLEQLEKTFVSIKRGQFVKGVVVQVSNDEVCINIGYKSDGIIKKEDLTASGNISPAEMFNPGDEIEAEVITLNDGEGNVRLSRKKIESQLKWKALVDELDKSKIFECKILKVIKGGVLTKLEGYDAFIPASQLSLKYVEDLNTFVGQTLEVKIIDVDKRQKRFVLSHKEVLLENAEKEQQKLFESFEKGSVVTGTVKRLTDFGAFVDVGGVDGLLHITDISWVRIKHPSEVLKENDKIDVKILNVDPEKKKISLGLKQLLPKPWELAPEKYLVGSDVEGTVVRIAPFGAFVQLEPSIDGLIHISQVSDHRIEKVEDVLSVGQVVRARVLEVNPEKKRISLSLRVILEEERAATQAEIQEKTSDEEETFSEESFEIPPIEEATATLADFFPKEEE